MGRRSGTGCCRRRSTGSGTSSSVRTTAIGRWSKLVLGLDPRILAAALSDGLPAVEAACTQALAKDLDDFAFKDTPINEALVRDLAGGGFIAQQRNVVLVGGTEPDS